MSSKHRVCIINCCRHNLLKDECFALDGDSRRLVVDVGANFGWYSLLAASMGCRVVAWEPVPHFAAFFKFSLLLNNMTRAVQVWLCTCTLLCIVDCALYVRGSSQPASLLKLALQLRETIVSNSSGRALSIMAPQRGIWGTASIDGANIDP